MLNLCVVIPQIHQALAEQGDVLVQISHFLLLSIGFRLLVNSRLGGPEDRLLLYFRGRLPVVALLDFFLPVYALLYLISTFCCLYRSYLRCLPD